MAEYEDLLYTQLSKILEPYEARSLIEGFRDETINKFKGKLINDIKDCESEIKEMKIIKDTINNKTYGFPSISTNLLINLIKCEVLE